MPGFVNLLIEDFLREKINLAQRSYVHCSASADRPARCGDVKAARLLCDLSQGRFFRTLGFMEVNFTPDLQAKIDQLVIETGRAPDELIEDAMAGYVAELAQTREMLDSRYDDLKSGRVKAIPSDEVIARLREKSTARRSKSGS